MINNFSKKKSLYVLYDSIANSVFKSQVLAPLFKRLNEDSSLYIVLLSFERHSQSAIAKKLPRHERLSLHLVRRTPFFGAWSLFPLIWKCKKIIQKESITHIIARGPFAGYIAHKANLKLPLSVQARGLVAEEFRFSEQCNATSKLKNKLFRMRYSMLFNLEKKVYSLKRENFSIEAVSQALSRYLEENFAAQKNYITIASYDIPSPLTREQKQYWRKTIREQLNIEETTFIYVYSGSAHAWQCVDEMMDYFCKHKSEHTSAFFLILTCHEEQFRKAVKKYNLAAHEYRIMNISPHNQFNYLVYLAAADAGLLFRKKDCINWVARPTKMLEYQAAQLPIIHNGTVELLSNDYKIEEP